MPRKRKTTEEFIQDAQKVHGDRYDYSKVNYMGTHNKVKIICKEHGEFEQKPAIHLQGSNCNICSRYKTNEIIIREAKEVHGDLYDYSDSNYKNSKSKVKIICREHGGFKQTPNNHILHKNRCPNCKRSKGEEMIVNFLKEKTIPYVTEHTYNDLKGLKGGTLRFDFYVPKLNMCIEYDGIQHFKHMEGWIPKDNFNTLIKNDKIKNEYCRKNNIRLLRIPYTEFDNIDKILLTELN